MFSFKIMKNVKEYILIKKDNKAISYDYDEFPNMLIKAGPFDFSGVNICCLNVNVLKQ
jgi:hypothetical protein